MADTQPLSAQRILTACNKMREELWPLWQRERALVNFYNSGPLPTDANDACDDDAPVSLGLGYRYIKKPLESLLDVILNKPGFLKTDVCYPLKSERKGMVQSAADKEANAIVHDRMESTMRSICGRAMITGRGFLFRLSRWDWKFRSGRLLCPIDAIDDVHDESFREWAFVGSLTLRHIDSLLHSTSRYDGKGWSHTHLQALKDYIIDTTVAEKTANRESIVRELCAKPFGDELSNNPLDVYWYFRKNGEKNDDGHEKVDLYCVTRWGMTANVISYPSNDGVTYKALQQTGSLEKQQIVYHLPNAFESVDECLIPMILDARIDGEQEMNQVEGVGRIMTPRLQSMEHITSALLEGIAFGVQPNWTSTTAGAVAPETLKALQRTGLSPWDFVPHGLDILDKNNSMQGLSQGMQILQMLGVSAEADAQTGEMSPNGQSQAKFKAEAMMMLQQIGNGLQRRSEKALRVFDMLAAQIMKTLSRALQHWKKGDPSYYDVRNFQTKMLVIHKILPAEYAEERMTCGCRRLAGGMDKQTAIQQGTQIMQFWGGMMSPEGTRYIAKEVARAMYDDPTADLLYPDQQPPEKTQLQAASDQNSKAIVDLQLPQRESTDNPLIHLPIHFATLEARLKLAMQAGSVTAAEREGLSALLVHTSQDARAVPQQQQQQVGQMLQQMAMVLQKLPVSGANSEMELKQRAAALKEQQFQFAQQREQNLVQDRNTKHELKQQQFLLSVQQFLEQQRNNGVTRAGQLLDMMEPTETPALPESAQPA